MPSSRRWLGAALVAALPVLALSGPASPASAGTPGTWTNVSGLSGATTNPNISISDPPVIARVGSGLLALWRQNVDGSAEVYRSASLSAAGKVTSPAGDALAGWGGLIGQPVVLALGGQTALAFSGLPPVDGSANAAWSSGRGFLATSSDGGRTFTPQPGALTSSTSTYAGYGFDAIPYAGSVLTVTSGSGLGLGEYYQTALQPGPAESAIEVPQDPQITIPGGDGCCSYDSAVAQDTVNGSVWTAFYANASASSQQGVFYAPLLPTAGTPKQAPGTLVKGESSSLSPDRRVGLAARVGGGVYLAYTTGYPTAHAILVRNVETGKSLRIRAEDAGQVGISSTPDGRLWVSWTEGNVAYAARSNPSATAFGATVKIGAPPSTDTLWRLTSVAGVDGRLDVLATASTHTKAGDSPNNVWHTQVYPALTATVVSDSAKAGKGGSVSVLVTDAGTPVSGAKVRLSDGVTATTGSKGTVSLSVPKSAKKGSLGVTATKAHYGRGVTKAKVS